MRRRGLTLVEILVVTAIIALLAGILIPVAQRVRVSGHRAAATAHLAQIGRALELYQLDHGARPRDFETLQASSNRLDPAVYTSPVDPYPEGFGTRAQQCYMRHATVKTIFEHILDWPDHLSERLRGFDANHGIVATRVFGNQNGEFAGKERARRCRGVNYIYEGTLLRLRVDGSVQTGRFKLTWGKFSGPSGPVSPMFRIVDLYTDNVPPDPTAF
jgi:prepilin-type N-terminal cleavage/methylation domain-containing protein